MGVYLDVIRKFSKAKITLRAHNVEYLIWERHLANEKNVLKRAYLSLQTSRLKIFEKKICREVDAFSQLHYKTDTPCLLERVWPLHMSQGLQRCLLLQSLK